MKQQQQQYDDTKHTENKPATTVRVLLRDFVSCEPLISFLRVCLIFSTYILKLMAYASYESSIVVVQQARKGWRSKTAWKLHVEKSNCNIPKNCGAGKHKVDVIKSHVRMLMIYSLTNLGFALSSSLCLLRAQSSFLLGLLLVEILELTSSSSLCNNIEIHC